MYHYIHCPLAFDTLHAIECINFHHLLISVSQSHILNRWHTINLLFVTFGNEKLILIVSNYIERQRNNTRWNDPYRVLTRTFHKDLRKQTELLSLSKVRICGLPTSSPRPPLAPHTCTSYIQSFFTTTNLIWFFLDLLSFEISPDASNSFASSFSFISPLGWSFHFFFFLHLFSLCLFNRF